MTEQNEQNGIERRYLEVAELRVAARVEDKPAQIVGYAAVFDKLSVEMWGFREQIAKGAFAKSLSNGDDVRALWNHDPAYVLGRTAAGTLALAEDDTGLRVEITPPDTELARGFLASIERGDVSQMSFGFRVLADDWSIDGDEQYIRTLLDVKLYEVSPVTFPAYPDTSVAMRSDRRTGGVQDPQYGWIPGIPAELRQAASAAASSAVGAATGAERARARLDLMHRRLILLSIETGGPIRV